MVHWTDKNNHWKSATQRVVQAHTRGFLRYISERVIFEKIDLSVLDSITTKKDVSKTKDVLTKEAFRQAEGSILQGLEADSFLLDQANLHQ